MIKHNIAELNVGRLRYPIGDGRVADFVNNLNRVNAAAERSPGFVWRLKDDNGSATSMAAEDDPLLIPNLSVWEDVPSVEAFVFQTVHKRFYQRRAEWFEVMERMHFVMWPVPLGHEPTLIEAYERLDHLNRYGSSDKAFGWDYAQTNGLWRAGRCGRPAA